MAGIYIGMDAFRLPPNLGLLLLALGLVLWGRWGRVVACLAVGAITGSAQPAPAFHPAADAPVIMGVSIAGQWQSDRESLRVKANGRWLRQGLRVGSWGQEVWLVLPASRQPPEFSHLRVKGYLRRSAGAANESISEPGPWTLRIKSRVFLQEDPAARSPVETWIQQIGNELRRQVVRRVEDWETRTSGLGPTWIRVLILGQSDRIPGPAARGLRAAGLAHLVALSGLHVGLLFGGMLMASSSGPLRLRVVLAITVVMTYVILAGARPSLIRAFLMMLALAISWLLKRPPQPVTTLAWVAASMAFWSPRLVNNLGFQLTVGATAGILLLAPILESRWGRIPAMVRRPFCISAAAHIGVLPWSLSTFHLVPLWSPLLNLIAVPMASIVLTVALLWVLIPSGVPAVGLFLEQTLDLAAWPLEVLGSLPPVVLGSFPVDIGWWSAFALGSLIVLMILGGGWHRYLCLGVATLIVVTACPRSPDRLEVIVLDVGQGEAIVLRDGKESVLLDGGGWRRGDIAQRVLLPALTSMGIRKLDGMILSHPDTDHCSGLLALTSYMSVRRLYTTGGWSRETCAAALLTRPGLEIRSLWRGESLQVGRWQLQTLHPRAGQRSGRNDRSLVLLAEAAGRKILLTGDLEASGEKLLLGVEGKSRLRTVDILKVGHHGSNSSTISVWLDRLKPRLALISCGIANRYGHPSSQVLERLGRRNIHILRTDRLGVIRISLSSSGRMYVTLPGHPRGLNL